MDNQKLIAQGNAAYELLNNETFTSVVNDLIQQYLAFAMQTKPNEQELREQAYYQSRGLQEIVGYLNQQVAVRDQILNQSEE